MYREENWDVEKVYDRSSLVVGAGHVNGQFWQMSKKLVTLRTNSIGVAWGAERPRLAEDGTALRGRPTYLNRPRGVNKARGVQLLTP